MQISNTNQKYVRIIIPDESKVQSENFLIYKTFSNQMRSAPISQPELKVLSSIHFTADILQYSDANISKTLVEMGLRAPRLSFPVEFLDYIDGALTRCGWEVGAPSDGLLELSDFWSSISEKSHPLSFRHIHSIIYEEITK